MQRSNKLLNALDNIKKLNQDGVHPSIIEAHQLTRADRELLFKTGWLREIIKGWYLFVRPDAPTQESTIWYAHFWEFLSIYLNKHYQDKYCLSAEASLAILLERPTTPKQVIINTVKGGSGSPRILPYNTSLLIYSDPKNIPEERIQVQGLQIMPLELALCRVAPVFFKKSPVEAEIALKSIKTASNLSNIILKYNLNSAANRLIGAYQFLNLSKIAIPFKEELESFGMKVVPENPFAEEKPLLKTARPISPQSGRIEALWSRFRQPIIDIFPNSTQKKPKNLLKYFKQIDNIYAQDAYHSLSIEGFKVTPELIERVKNNEWNPDLYQQDFELRNAFAARGYYEAFQAVKKSIFDIFNQDKNSGEIVELQLQSWFRSLFAPSVRAGLISEHSLLGYRKHSVYIRNSRHIPSSPESVVDCMETFFDCLKNEPNPGVRVILGHYIFVYIHPYMDGNGRIGRFLMNTMLCSGGYPWVIVPVEQRTVYMKALEIAGIEYNILPFTKFIVSLLS